MTDVKGNKQHSTYALDRKPTVQTALMRNVPTRQSCNGLFAYCTTSVVSSANKAFLTNLALGCGATLPMGSLRRGIVYWACKIEVVVPGDRRIRHSESKESYIVVGGFVVRRGKFGGTKFAGV